MQSGQKVTFGQSAPVISSSPNPPENPESGSVKRKIEKFEQQLQQKKEEAERSSPRSKTPSTTISRLDLSTLYSAGLPNTPSRCSDEPFLVSPSGRKSSTSPRSLQSPKTFSLAVLQGVSPRPALEKCEIIYDPSPSSSSAPQLRMTSKVCQHSSWPRRENITVSLKPVADPKLTLELLRRLQVTDTGWKNSKGKSCLTKAILKLDKNSVKLPKKQLPDICTAAFKWLSNYPLKWPHSEEEIDAAKPFANFDGYKTPDSYEQDVRGWTTLNSPIFGSLQFEGPEGERTTIDTTGYDSGDSVHDSADAFLLEVVKQARNQGYAEEIDLTNQAIVTNLQQHMFVPYFSRLMRAGANGIFAPPLFMTRKILQVDNNELRIEHKCLDEEKKLTSSGIRLTVKVLGNTNFITTYIRRARLLNQDKLLAKLQWTWQLRWVKDAPPEGTLQMELKPEDSLTTEEQLRLLRTWTLGLKEHMGPLFQSR